MTDLEKKELREELKEFFVSKTECDNNMGDMKDKYSKIDTKIEVLCSRVNSIVKLTWLIAASVIGCLVELILRR